MDIKSEVGIKVEPLGIFVGIGNSDQSIEQDAVLENPQVGNFYTDVNIKNEIEIKDDTLNIGEYNMNFENFEEKSKADESQIQASDVNCDGKSDRLKVKSSLRNAPEIEEFCVISDLLLKPFSLRTEAEKNEIVKKGRPCPEIPNLTCEHKTKNDKYIRHFRVSQYKNIPWLTGSKKLNKLFCWQCLLFSKDNGAWVKTGFSNLNCLTLAINRHEKSLNHLKCFITLKKFGRAIIDHQLNEQQRISNQMHNENVQKNRYILKRLIDVVCFLGKQVLPFRGHDESDISQNKGNYIELLEFVRQYDPILESHFKDSAVFQGTSPTIQSELIVSVSSVLTDRIKQELEQTDFIALILDETSEVINKSQLSSVLRFVDQNGQIQERFLHFTDMCSDRSAATLLEHVKIVLNDFNCGKKLIAQTYDGAAVMAEQVSCLNTKITELYPTAVFIHCYSHIKNLTLQQSVTNIKECRTFFQTLTGLSSFFSVSSKQTHALQCFVEKEFPSDAPTRWNFTSRIVNTVKEKYDLILKFFAHVIDHSEDCDCDTLIKAQGFLSFLEKFQTRFLLNVFSEIFSITDVLFNIIRKKSMNIEYCVKKVEEKISMLEEIREHNFMKFYEKVSERGDDDERPFKKLRLDIEHDVTEYNRLFLEILDNILIQIKNRFHSMEKFDFLCLLNSKMYAKYNKNFPEKSLKSLGVLYGQLFDITRLKNELSVLYCSQEFKDIPAFDLIRYMNENDLQIGLKEVYKLAKLIATIPTTTPATTERTFSTLQRIKTYCCSSRGQEEPSSLALLSVEKSLLDNVRIQSTFYDEVLQKFLEKNRRAEFIFR